MVCERKNLEAQDLSFALFRAGGVLGGTCTQGCAVACSPGDRRHPLAAGLYYAGLSGQAFDAVPLYVTFDCTRVFVLNFVHSYIIVAVKKRRARELNSWRMVEDRSRFESEMTIPIELEGSKAGR